MKRVMVGAITMALVLCGVAAAAQQNGNSAGAKLQTDLRRAVMNGKRTDAQKRTLQQAGETMREAAQANQSGGSVDRDAVKKAMAGHQANCR